MNPIERLRSALEAIKGETVPMPGHSDPGALQDCWATVFETIAQLDKEITEVREAMVAHVPSDSHFWQKQLELNHWVFPKQHASFEGLINSLVERETRIKKRQNEGY